MADVASEFGRMVEALLYHLVGREPRGDTPPPEGPDAADLEWPAEWQSRDIAPQTDRMEK